MINESKLGESVKAMLFTKWVIAKYNRDWPVNWTDAQWHKVYVYFDESIWPLYTRDGEVMRMEDFIVAQENLNSLEI